MGDDGQMADSYSSDKMAKKLYCEQCFSDDIKHYIELADGTIVCSDICKERWEIERRAENPDIDIKCS